LQCLDLDHLTLNPPTCSCSLSPFNYSSAGHVIKWGHEITHPKGPKFREPQSFNWRQSFISIMNAVEDYTKRWAKPDNEELDTLSEWFKGIRGIIRSQIRNFKSKVRTSYPSVFSKIEVITWIGKTTWRICFRSSW
jgi:hypothetical protein